MVGAQQWEKHLVMRYRYGTISDKLDRDSEQIVSDPPEWSTGQDRRCPLPTSRMSLGSRFSTRRAFRISGRPSSNWTSTTAPMTETTCAEENKSRFQKWLLPIYCIKNLRQCYESRPATFFLLKYNMVPVRIYKLFEEIQILTSYAKTVNYHRY